MTYPTHGSYGSGATCALCGRTVTETTVTHEERRGDRLYLFEHVPAFICASCGEVWIGDETLREMDRLIAGGAPTRTVATPVFDFASAPRK